MYFITIDIIKLEHQHTSIQYTINLSVNPIINISFNKYPMSWDIIHRRLIYPSDSIMKAMCRHQNIYRLPKHCPNKIHKSPCTICYISNISTINKVTTVNTSNLHPGDLINMEFAFYKVTSIHGFTSIFTVVCENIIML